MTLHLFGWSGRHGVDVCRVCGAERELLFGVHGGRPFWLYRRDGVGVITVPKCRRRAA